MRIYFFLSSTFQHASEPLLERLGGRGTAAHEQDGVVAADRAGDFGKLRAINPLGQPLSLAAVGSKYQQGLNPLERPVLDLGF